MMRVQKNFPCGFINQNVLPKWQCGSIDLKEKM